MNNETTFTEIVIWSSPVIVAFATWAIHEIYSTVKSDLSEIKKTNVGISTKLNRMETKIETVDFKVGELAKRTESIGTMTHEIDKRTGNTREMVESMKHIETKLREQQTEYGKIILVLKKVIQIIRPKSNPPN